MLSPGTALAQLSLQPAVMQMDASASSQRRVVRVTNEGDAPERMRFYAQDFAQDTLGMYTFGAAGTMVGSCGSRLRLTPSEAVIAPGLSQDVVLEIAAGPVPCWAMVTAESAPRAVGGGMPIGVRMGAKLYVAPGSATRELSVLQTTARAQGDSVLVSIQMRNTGPTPVHVGGSVELRDLSSTSTVGKTRLQAFGVLPGQERWHSVLTPRPRSGEHAALVVLDFGGEYLAGGQALVREP